MDEQRPSLTLPLFAPGFEDQIIVTVAEVNGAHLGGLVGLAQSPVVQVCSSDTVRALYNTSSGRDCVKSLGLSLHGKCPQNLRSEPQPCDRDPLRGE